MWWSKYIDVKWMMLAVGLSSLLYWGNGNHLAVEVPVVDPAVVQRLQQEKEILQRRVSDYKALSVNLAGRLKEANGRLAKLEEERKVLAHSSVPSQPVILQAVQKEAETPEGFKRVVARGFGQELAGRIRVIE